MKRYLVVLITLGCLLGVRPAVNAYTFTALDDPNSNGTYTVASGINTSGQIVGYFQDTSVVYHGFLYRRGHFTTIDDPHAGVSYGQGTFPNGISDDGTIVGYYTDSSNVVHGFVRDRHGRFTSIDPPGATYTVASGINESESGHMIVGYYYDGATYHGFLRDKSGHFTPIDDPNACYGTFPNGISGDGTIVGASSRCDHGYGFVRDRETGSFTAIDPFGTTYTWAAGIDAAGRNIVGIYQNYYLFCSIHTYLLRHGTFTTLDDPAASGGCQYEQGTWALGVNSWGTIVGYIVDSSDHVHGFVATAD